MADREKILKDALYGDCVSFALLTMDKSGKARYVGFYGPFEPSDILINMARFIVEDAKERSEETPKALVYEGDDH